MPRKNKLSFKDIVDRETKKFLKDESARTYTSYSNPGFEKPKNFVAHFQLDADDDPIILRCTDWGCCYDWIPVPENRADLVANRMRAQMGLLLDGVPNVVAVNYYLGLQKALDKAGV